MTAHFHIDTETAHTASVTIRSHAFDNAATAYKKYKEIFIRKGDCALVPLILLKVGFRVDREN